jgi:thiol-disulfide isomerase/thioredoxin
MGRLPALIGWALPVVAACDTGSSATTTARSDQVIATGPASVVAPPPPSSSAHSVAVPPRARRLCDSDADVKGRVLPRVSASHAEASGEPQLDGDLPKADGQWLWVNFWAAWCAPCKEEMPRLIGWRDRLAKAHVSMHLVFVSLDDDERQLDTFLEAQGQAGVRSTLWLPEGPARSSWLKSLRMKPGPELPEQVLVDPSRHVRCFIEGAVEDSDYPEISSLVSQ